jgi:hypothetical protein
MQPLRETFTQAGYKYVMQGLDGTHILLNLNTKEFERWAKNLHHASYGLLYKNTHLEFCGSYNEHEKERLLAYMRKVQNFGEQHPDFHNTMMNLYRKYIAI